MAHNSEAASISAIRPVINSNASSASPSTQDQANRDSQLVRMFCLDVRPSYILNDGLLEFIAQVSHFGLPSEDKFSEELIPQEFNRARSELMKTLESVHHVAISIETWKWGTDNRDTDMFTVTAHFVHQLKIVSQILFTLELKQLAFPDKIGKAIKKRLIDWEVYKKVACIVSESFKRHFDMLDAAEIFIPIRKPLVSCVASKLNFIIQRSLRHLNFDELEMKCQNDDSKSLIKKKKDEPFCWHDQFTVLKYISENNAGDFTEDERNSLRECFEVLKPFEDFNNKMSKNSPSTQREFFVIMILTVAFVFQGLPVVMVYAEPLFAEALPPDVISPNLCSVLMGVVMIISGSISAYLTDVVGRRPLLIYSSIAAGFCCIVLGTQILTEWGPKWTIPMFIYAFTTFYTFGAGTVTVVVLAEVFLPEVKSIMSMLAVEWAWILNFLVLFVFNLLVTSVGLPPVFYIFSFACFSTAVFFFYCLPETKGLPVYDIQELFMKKNRLAH